MNLLGLMCCPVMKEIGKEEERRQGRGEEDGRGGEKMRNSGQRRREDKERR